LYSAGRKKPLTFLGDSLERPKRFPRSVRRSMGYQLERVQWGQAPDDGKPLRTIGPGVAEIRVRDTAGAFRVVYLARRMEAVYVLHAFQKKTRKTPQPALELARLRLERLVRRMP
jgi:phage-related protein